MAISNGMGSTWSSPILPKLNDPNRTDESPFDDVIDSELESWLASLSVLGTIFGPFPFGLLADLIGRKHTLLVASVPVCASYLTLAFAEKIYLYYVARFFIGFVGGGVVAVLLMYVGEVAEVRNRGSLASFYNSSLGLGLLLSYILGAYLSITVFNVICAAVPATFFVLFLVFAPESPAFLISKGKRERAFENLKMLRAESTKEIEKELEEIKKEIEKSREGHLKDLITNRGTLKALVITMALMGFQMLSGIIVILSYTSTIFDATGSDIPSEILSIIIGAIQFSSSFITPFVVDRLG